MNKLSNRGGAEKREEETKILKSGKARSRGGSLKKGGMGAGTFLQTMVY